MSSEFTRIARLRALFGSAPAGVVLGIGDDAAVLAPNSLPLVWTVDASVEGTHFRRDLLSLEDIGYRATMAAASDLAAMGAAPIGILSALVLPPSLEDAELLMLAQGQRQAAVGLGTNIIGGNLAHGPELSITTTVIGKAARPLQRSGARPGQALWMVGAVGLAAAGLALLFRERDPLTATFEADREAAVAAWRRPKARITEALVAAPVAHSAIDISDGLAQDVWHLAEASEVRIILEDQALILPELRSVAAALGQDPLALALRGGEDYAVVVTAPDVPIPGFTRIGQVEEGPPFVGLRGADGRVVCVERGGYDHFRRTPDAAG